MPVLIKPSMERAGNKLMVQEGDDNNSDIIKKDLSRDVISKKDNSLLIIDEEKQVIEEIKQEINDEPIDQEILAKVADPRLQN